MTEPMSRELVLFDMLKEYCELVDAGLHERWSRLELDLYDSETYEAIGGLLARQATLTIHLASTPQEWTAHVAPMLLRAMVDAHITLAWILRAPKERARQYILYGLGQEKLFIEHLKAARKSPDETDERVEMMIEFREGWLNSQRHDFLTEVNVGSWSGVSTRQMAEEADCLSLYNFAYLPFSGAVHSMWQHVAMYNLRPCLTPLHKFHKVPAIADLPLDPDFVYRSAKYVSRSYELIDQTYDLACDSPMPVTWLGDKLARFYEAQDSEAEPATASVSAPHAAPQETSMKLSAKDRVILVNQYEVLKRLSPEDAGHYQELIEILTHGYEIFYSDIDAWMRDGMSPEEGSLVLDVLDLYRVLDDYMRQNPKDEEVSKHPWARFVGFDGNTETAYMSFTRFLVDTQGKFGERKAAQGAGHDFNSHHPTLDKYRHMIAKWLEAGREFQLSKEAILDILNA